MRRALLWPMAAAISLAAHGALVGGLALAIQPQPFAPQPMPAARLDIIEQQVDRSTAASAEPSSEAAPRADATGASLGEAAIPESRAAPARPEGQRLAPAPAPAPVASVLPPDAAPLAAAAPSADRPQPAVLPQDPAAVVTPPSAAASRIALPSEPLAPDAAVIPASAPRVALPSEPISQAAGPAPELPVLQPPASPAAAQVLAASALAPAAPAASTAPSLPPPTTHAKAALAWTGDAGPVDPLSLAAIAAFMQPGDLATSAANAGQLRDGIESVLASVPCARLQTTFIPETGTLELRGHVPEDALRGPVLAALRAQVGTAIPVADRLLVLPRPQCGALAGIAALGLSQSDEQITNPRVIGPDAFVRDYRYTAGERLKLDLSAPDYASVIYVDYFDAQGNVIHLQPNEVVPLERVAPKTVLTVGQDRAGQPALNITIAPPFGQEIAAAFAASVPLYEGLRPMVEPAAPYLGFLQAQVAARRAETPDFKGEWVYFFISTAAQ